MPSQLWQFAELKRPSEIPQLVHTFRNAWIPQEEEGTKVRQIMCCKVATHKNTQTPQRTWYWNLLLWYCFTFFFHTNRTCSLFLFCFPKPSKTSISVNQHATICNDSKFFPNDWPSSPTVNITHLNPPYDRSSDWANKVTHRPSCMFTKTDKLWQNSIPSQEMFIAN